MDWIQCFSQFNKFVIIRVLQTGKTFRHDLKHIPSKSFLGIQKLNVWLHSKWKEQKKAKINDNIYQHTQLTYCCRQRRICISEIKNIYRKSRNSDYIWTLKEGIKFTRSLKCTSVNEGQREGSHTVHF